MANTEHYQLERQFREDFIQEVIGGYGEMEVNLKPNPFPFFIVKKVN